MKYCHVAFTWFRDQPNKLFILIIQTNYYFGIFKMQINNSYCL